MRTDMVLVAIDDQKVQNLAATALRSVGYSVVEIADLETFPTAGQKIPGLVVMDSAAPGRRGEQLLQRLRRARPDLKALFLIDRDATPLDADAHLHKPFFLHELSEAVADCLLFGRCRCPSCLRKAVARK
jgi:DNA-binding response OmpR family regulator